ncbi:MAG: beta-lactamase family protein [Gemmatimonadetes bacterium]|nr:beta-lactamase family protein [Gemmatimonadota bacterium]
MLPASLAAQRRALVPRERLVRIDSALERAVTAGDIPGGVLLVLRDGQPAYLRAVGWADKEANRRMSAGALFRIASQTKALTSAAILMLIEEGKIGLGTPVGRIIPNFAKTTVAVKTDSGRAIVPAQRQITIRDLLTHTSGYSYGSDSLVASLYAAKGLGPVAGYGGWYLADRDEDVCYTMSTVGTLPAVAQPGEQWVYGYNTDILGCVVERVSGQRLDEFFRERITGPLGMKDTKFWVDTAERARLAAVYMSGDDGKVVRAPDGARGQGHYVDGPRRDMAGGAGLVSTAADYARFLEMIRNDGVANGKRLLSPRSVALMHTNLVGGLYRRDGTGGFGLGFEVVQRLDGYRSIGSYGWGGAYGPNYYVDPDNGLTVVWMMQVLPSRAQLPGILQALVAQAFIER